MLLHLPAESHHPDQSTHSGSERSSSVLTCPTSPRGLFTLKFVGAATTSNPLSAVRAGGRDRTGALGNLRGNKDGCWRVTIKTFIQQEPVVFMFNV